MIFKRLHRKIFLSTALLTIITCLYVATVILNDDKYLLTSSHWIFLHNNSHSNLVDDLNQVVNIKKLSIVFIKIMKCASTSLSQLLLRLAYEHDLELVIPLSGKIYIGWPYLPKQSYILKPIAGHFYHVCCDHVIYDRSFFDSIMYSNTKYITSLRHPYTQLKSMVNYFNVLNISGVPHLIDEAKRFQHYMLNLEYYDALYRQPNSSRLRHCVPDHFSMTKNLMSYSLGFSFLGGFDISVPNLEGNYHFYNEEAINIDTYLAKERVEKAEYQSKVDEWLSKLDKEIDLVLIVEWLPESLVLMKRMFSWDIKDVLILNSNALSYNFKNSENSLLESIYQSWSWIDYELYIHFNTSLWQKLDSQPTSFWSEVHWLKEILSLVARYCSEEAGNTTILIEESAWNDRFEVDSNFCLSKDQYSNIFRSRYHERSKKRREGTKLSSTEINLVPPFC